MEEKKRGRPKKDNPKVQWAMKLHPEFIAELDEALYWARFWGVADSVTEIFEKGARMFIADLLRNKNGGKPFPPRQDGNKP